MEQLVSGGDGVVYREVEGRACTVSVKIYHGTEISEETRALKKLHRVFLIRLQAARLFIIRPLKGDEHDDDQSILVTACTFKGFRVLIIYKAVPF